jgi:hypothetical protein
VKRAKPKKRAAKRAPFLRWHVYAEYDDVGVRADFEELHELHDWIERGPDWNTLSQITITLNRGPS